MAPLLHRAAIISEQLQLEGTQRDHTSVKHEKKFPHSKEITGLLKYNTLNLSTSIHMQHNPTMNQYNTKPRKFGKMGSIDPLRY